MVAARPAPRDRQPKQQKKAAEKKPPILRITFDGKTYDLDPNQLGPADDRICRQQYGLPLSGLLAQDAFGGDSLIALVWTCRRKYGEPNITYAEVEAAYPTNADLARANFDIVSIDAAPEV